VGNLRIVRAGAERIPDIEPLTRDLHAHHLTVDPDIPGIPPRDADAWWAIRSERYAEWLGHEGAFVLIAEDDEGPAGYALVSFHERDDSHTTGARFAELHSLAVADGRRGQGIGTRLLRAVYREVRAAGVEEMMIGVLATNEPAMRLYEREGFTPWVVLTFGKVPEVD
jgi:GNAT superfamily N-acetyltransferase